MPRHLGFDDKNWELDQALATLEEAKQIQEDPKMMAEIERHLKEKQENFQEIERQLFGSDESSDDSTD